MGVPPTATVAEQLPALKMSCAHARMAMLLPLDSVDTLMLSLKVKIFRAGAVRAVLVAPCIMGSLE